MGRLVAENLDNEVLTEHSEICCSTVTTVTGLWAGWPWNPGSIPSRDNIFFSLLLHIQTDSWRLPSLLRNVYWGTPFIMA